MILFLLKDFVNIENNKVFEDILMKKKIQVFYIFVCMCFFTRQKKEFVLSNDICMNFTTENIDRINDN